MKKVKATPFFEIDEEWKKEWDNMPEFNQEDLKPFQSILVHFESEEDRKEFAELVEQKLTGKTKFIWYPKKEHANLINIKCSDES